MTEQRRDRRHKGSLGAGKAGEMYNELRGD